MDGSVKPAPNPIDSLLPDDSENPPRLVGSEDAISPFDEISSSASPRRIKQIWAVGGGKGGVGKSLIASSIGISLARRRNRVIAIDLDLGGANLHTTLGVDVPRQTLSDYFTGRTTHLQDCVTPTMIPDLQLISGAQDAVGIPNLQAGAKKRLLNSMLELDADYLILDLGAGTSLHTIDFFLFSDVGIIAMLPEPTSIENAYRFIKSAYYRRLRLAPPLAPVAHLIEQAMDGKNTLGIKSPSDLFRSINDYSPELGMRLKEQISRFSPKLVINQARTQTDIDIGSSVKTVCKKYFGLDMDYLGYLDYDSAVWQAVRRKRPMMLEFPNSRLVSSFERIAQLLLKKHADSRNDLFG
jgi:flagellar biosynthesis protein FlhG